MELLPKEDSWYFRSKRGWLSGLIIWGINGWIFYAMILPFFSWVHLRENWITALFIIPVWLGLLWLMGSIWFLTGYTITADYLFIRSGPVNAGPIPIDQIGYLERSYGFSHNMPGWVGSNAPALAIRGIKVHYWGGNIKLSPKNEKGFIAKIKELNPSVKLVNL